MKTAEFKNTDNETCKSVFDDELDDLEKNFSKLFRDRDSMNKELEKLQKERLEILYKLSNQKIRHYALKGTMLFFSNLYNNSDDSAESVSDARTNWIEFKKMLESHMQID